MMEVVSIDWRIIAIRPQVINMYQLQIYKELAEFLKRILSGLIVQKIIMILHMTCRAKWIAIIF